MVWDDHELTAGGHSTNGKREIILMRNGGSAHSGLVQFVEVWSVGISVSPCADAARIGYDERQINRIVIRMAQYFLDQNMRVIFGHDWREDGVMRAVADFAEAVAAGTGSVREGSDDRQPGNPDHNPKPRMLNVVPTGKESLSRTALEAHRDSGGVLRVIPIRDLPEHQFELLLEAANRWDNVRERSGRAAELTALRIFITEQLNPGCRICLGGKTTGYVGREPGVMEEARLALRYGKPLYLMGGFGGVSRMVGKSRVYWNTENGLNEEQKRELFETTDVERALRLISTGIQICGRDSRVGNEEDINGIQDRKGFQHYSEIEES